MSALIAALLAMLMSWAGVPGTPGIASTDPTLPTPGTTAASGSVRLMVVGDMMLARGVGDRIAAEGVGAAFQKVQGILDRADLLIGNLECVVSTRGTQQQKLYTFRARPKAVGALRRAGFDLVGLANNHALDFGRPALGDTIRTVRAAGIRPMGAGADASAARAPVIVERNGLRIAFLDRADAHLDSNEWPRLHWEATDARSGLAYARPAELRADVRAARKQADVVVVMLHSGREYAKGPTKAQRRVVEAAVAGGAALVVSAHPHVLQRGERRGTTFIAWSMGNFLFDGFETVPGARDSAILDVTLTRHGVQAVRWHPVIVRRGFPKPAVGADARRILGRLGAR
jgi:poly-gamma-glutamate capsule biosynthesis protein CapA/YwtB (metallophosphatase superfamily)